MGPSLSHEHGTTSSHPCRPTVMLADRSDGVIRWACGVWRRGSSPSDVAADAEALARVEGKCLNETVKQSLIEAVERRWNNPKFKARLAKIIEQDRELLERLTRVPRQATFAPFSNAVRSRAFWGT